MYYFATLNYPLLGITPNTANLPKEACFFYLINQEKNDDH